MTSWISNIGFFVFLIGGINTVWVLFWYVLTISGTYGAKLSKKTGTSNQNTDKNIEVGESFSSFLLGKLLWRAIVTAIGAGMYYLG